MKRKQRKVLSILLSLAMLCSLAMPTAFAADSRYIDTTDHWAETAIERWSDYGVVEGYGNAFNPDNSITRGQMATILSKTLGLTEEAENPFSDISADDWYAPYVLRCYKAGIMLGDNGKANPDAEITRQEAMTMFCRAFGIKADETADLTSFKDSGAIADWALPYVSALINGGIVSGVSSDMVAPAESMSRAALVTILDRAVVQYINTSGEYDLTNKDGIILVTAGDTTLKGETKADILISQATDGKAVTFKDAAVTGEVTVQADTKIISNNSKLPQIDATVEVVKKETPKKPSGGSSGGSSRPTISNLTISEEKAVTSGTYNNVTITDAVADGEVTLSNITIKGDLTINGGGSSSIKLDNCTIQGKVIMAKETGEAPRLELTNTPVATVEVQKPAIIEAVDSASAVTKIEAIADIEIKGENTKIDTLAVPETAESAVAVAVTAGNISTVEAKAETTVTGASNSVNTIVATAAVTADSEAVQKVEIPETATESVSVTVTGDEAVDVEINSTSGAAVTGTNVTVSTTLETAPDNITVGGEAVTHIHKWGEPATTPATCEQDGEKTYTCIAEGCDDTAKTKTEVIPSLGHKYGDWKKSDDDLHVRECANDKDHYEKQEHTWDEGKITTEANCGQDGVKTYTCSVCKGTKTETIGKPEHNWGDWVKVDATSHKRVCKNNATHIETADHTPIIDSAVDATCTETGKTEGSHCDVCKSVIVEQTTTPALNHDFTGEYEKDADGHWHICERDNCEETDTKAGHTYNTTNCAEVATCTICKYEKPAGEHTWSKWEKVDDTNHKHTCSCSATETEEHKWDDGEITTEPTETTEGVKTYTCSVCKGTKTEAVPVLPEENEPTFIYSFDEAKGLRIKWTEATLSEGQSYYVTIKEPSSQYNCTSASFPVGAFTSKDNIESGKISIKVDVGTEWKETSALYEEKEIANITVNSTVPQFTIEKDDNGAYNFVSDANGGLWVYQVYNEEGLLTYSGNAINGAVDSYANLADGHTVKARYMTWTFNDDKTFAEISLSGIATYTYRESASSDVKITLVQEGDSIKATWTGTGLPNYYFEIEDSNGKYVTSGWTNGDECYTSDLTHYLPRADVSATYSFAIYSADENYNVVEEIARLDNCIEITVSGDAVEYDMAFNDGEDGVHKVTLTGDTLPNGIKFLESWYDASGKQRGMGSSTITKNSTEHQAIQNGYSYDLRVLTTCVLDGQIIKATMTPPSKKTYVNEDEPKIKWNDGGAIAWQAVANADDYKLNIYSGNTVDSTKLVATKNIGTYSTVYQISSNFDIAELAEYKDTVFTVELLALDTNDNVIETVGVLAAGINLTFTESAPEFSFEVTGEKTYTITFAEGTPNGMRYSQWYDAEGNKSGGMSGFGMTQLTNAGERAYAFADGDTIKVYIATVDTITDTVWTITRTPDAVQTYTTEETDASLLSFRKWNTDIMFDGYDDVADTKSLEVDGIKVLSTEAETMSEFLFDYDQTKGNITDADFVVELDGIEKERINGNVDVTLSNTDVVFTINTDGTLSFDATTHGSFAYETTTKDGMTHQVGRIAFKNGTLVDGWTLPTLADGETIDIMHIDCIYEENSKTISATISKHTTKTYTAATEKNIWFSENEHGRLMLNWKAVELASDERYYYGKDANGYDGEYIETQHSILNDVANVETAETRSVTIFKGTWLDHDEVLYTAEDVISVAISGTAQNYNVVGQNDGKYKIVPTDNNIVRNGFFYEIYAPDGTKLCGNFTSSGNISASLYDGCKIKIREIKWVISDDAKTVNIILTPISTVETFTQVSVPAETVNVTTFAELESALAIGGKVKLSNDITSSKNLMVYTGAPSELVLNGHILDVPKLQIEYGKTLVIDGTAEGSRIKYTNGQNTIRVYSGASLTLNNGKYECVYSSNGREIIINNASIISPIEQSAVHLYFVPDVKISEGTYETSGNGSAISVMGCENVEIDNVSMKGTYSGFNAQQTEKAVISNSSFVGESYSIQVVDNTSLTLSGNTLLNNKPFNISGNSSISAIIGTYDMDMTDYLADAYALTDNGDGTYTVAEKTEVSTDKNIWFSEDGDGIYVEWKETELADGEKYFITMKNPESLFTRTHAELDLGTFFDESDIVNGKLSIKVDKGTSWSDVENLYDEKEFANVTLTNTTPDFTIEKDITGKYKFVSDLSGGAWVYTTYDGNGNLMYVGNVVDGAIDTYANFADGHTVKARYITWTLNDDKTFAEFSVSNIATYTYKESATSDVKITLVQNGTSINATWTGANCDNGYTWALIEDGDIHQLDFVGKNVSSTSDFKPDLTRIESGVHSYDFVLYEYDESAEDCIGKELGRLENAIEVTIAGESVDYTMSFTAPADGQYQITLDDVPNVGDTYLTNWNRNRSNYSSIYVSDGTQTYTETTFMGALQDGDVYDLRLLTTYTLEGQTIKATMTPASKKTYHSQPVYIVSSGNIGLGMRVVCPLPDAPFTMASGATNLDGIVETATLKWGDTEVITVNGNNIRYKDGLGYYFNINIGNGYDSRLEGMTLTFTPAENAGFEEFTVTNDAFVYSHTDSEEPMPQDGYTVSYSEADSKILFENLELKANYDLVYIDNSVGIYDGYTLSIDWDTEDRFCVYTTDWAPWSQYDGHDFSLTKTTAIIGGNSVTFETTRPVHPMNSGRYFGEVRAESPVVLNFDRGDGELKDGVFTCSTNDNATYEKMQIYFSSPDGIYWRTPGCITTDATMTASSFISSTFSAFAGDISDLNGFYLLITPENDSDTKDYPLLLKVKRERGSDITANELNYSFAGNADYYYELIAATATGATSILYPTAAEDGTVSGHINADMVNPALYSWDGNFTKNNDGTVSITMTYHVILTK